MNSKQMTYPTFPNSTITNRLGYSNVTRNKFYSPTRGTIINYYRFLSLRS